MNLINGIHYLRGRNVYAFNIPRSYTITKVKLGGPINVFKLWDSDFLVDQCGAAIYMV